MYLLCNYRNIGPYTNARPVELEKAQRKAMEMTRDRKITLVRKPERWSLFGMEKTLNGALMTVFNIFLCWKVAAGRPHPTETRLPSTTRVVTFMFKLCSQFPTSKDLLSITLHNMVKIIYF